MSVPLAFISYSHDSEQHKAWVLQLATDLRSNGVDATLDQWDLSPGQDMAAFMQSGITESDRVLMVCSAAYVSKADGGLGGVGYERLVITGELVANIDTKKFLPILRDNPSAQKTPAYLGPRRYIDFTRDVEYQSRLEELLRELHTSPATSKPPLGPNPFSGNVPGGAPASRTTGPTGVTASGGLLLDDAWFLTNEQTASIGLGKLDFKGSMELRFALHSPIAKSQIELLNAVRKSQIHTFGWPIGIVLDNREEFRPRPMTDGIRAEVSVTQLAFTGRPSYDYWALRETGDFYLLQSLFEDDREAGVIFFNSRIVRVTEAFLFAANLYDSLAVPGETKVSTRVTHRGLNGRILSSSNPMRRLFERSAATVDVSQSQVVEEVGNLRTHLVANVRRVTEPLFMVFDFAQFDSKVYEDIVTSFSKGQST
jgi:hypothetical protein